MTRPDSPRKSISKLLHIILFVVVLIAPFVLIHSVVKSDNPVERNPYLKADGSNYINLDSTDISQGIEPHLTEFSWGKDDSFTIEFWVRGQVGQTCATTDEVIVGQGNISSGGWFLGCIAQYGYPIFQLSDTDGISLTLQSKRAINDGAWHHIVVTRDAARSVNTLYVDGTESNSDRKNFTGSFSSHATNVDLLAAAPDFTGEVADLTFYGGVLPRNEILGHYFLVQPYGASCSTPVRIMPLGDSITRGYGSGDPGEEENFPYNVGYREELYQSLIGADHYFDFVGSQYHGYATSGASFDFEHEGHGGRSDDWIAARVYDFLTNSPADVVLLHIGTNNLEPSSDDVEDILNEIDDYDEDITVILARIIDQASKKGDITTFNNNVVAMAEARITAGDKIIIVDQQNALDYGTDMYDNLHPKDTGYNKMAAVWFNALNGFLPVCGAVNIVSEPVIVASAGEQYSYDVDAIGNPNPSYALNAAAQGMSINAPGGLLTWTPGNNQIGAHNVTVGANNGASSDSQNYTVEVRELAGCPSGMDNYWKLDEKSGSLFRNYYYSLDDAVYDGPGSPGYANGKVNGAVNFNGTSDKLTSIGGTTNSREAITVMAWINPDNLNTHDRGIITNDNGISLDIESDGDRVSFVIFSRDAFWEFEPNVPGNQISTGTWTHVAATYTGNESAAARKVELYINGSFVASNSTIGATVPYSSIYASTMPYNIGWSRRPLYDTPVENRYFDGRIDEVATFDRALTAGEIQQLYNAEQNGTDYCGNNMVDSEITITKSPAAQEVVLGATADFTVNITNTGSATLTNIQVSDPTTPNCARANLGSLTAGNTISYNCSLANVTTNINSTATVNAQTPAYAALEVDAEPAIVTLVGFDHFTFLPIIIK